MADGVAAISGWAQFGSTRNNPASDRARRFINSIPKRPRRLGRINREKVFYIPLDNKYYGALQRAVFAKLFGKVLKHTPKPRRVGAQLT
jgi:hypothetical protein